MFSNSGIIVELKTKKVIVMTEDFDFVEMKRELHMATGQRVDLNDIKLYKGHSIYPGKVVKGIAAFAAVIILFMVIGLNHINFRDEVFAYVNVDINPSVELAIDDSYKVIKVRPINHDSEEIINSLELEKVQLVNALDVIINKSQELGYINESSTQNSNTILVSWALNFNIKDTLKEDGLKSQLDSFDKKAEDERIDTRILKMNIKDKKFADEYGISLGRYYIFMEAKEKAPDLLLEDIKVKGISDLLDAIGEKNSEDESTNNNEYNHNKKQQTETTATNSPEVTDMVSPTGTLTTTTLLTTPMISPTPTPTVTLSLTPTPTPTLSPSYSSTPKTTPGGMSLWYRFDGAQIASDASGNEVDGALVDTPERVEGAIGKGISLDGVNDFIECGKSKSLQPSSISVAFWIQRTDSWNDKERIVYWAKPNGNYVGNGWFVTSNDTGAQRFAILMCVDGLNYFYVKEEPDQFFPINTWVHITLTFDSETDSYKIYKNGEIQPVSIYGKPESITPSPDIKYLGYNSPGYNNSFFHGKLDEFRIYNYILTQDEVKALVNVE